MSELQASDCPESVILFLDYLAGQPGAAATEVDIPESQLDLDVLTWCEHRGLIERSLDADYNPDTGSIYNDRGTRWSLTRLGRAIVADSRLRAGKRPESQFQPEPERGGHAPPPELDADIWQFRRDGDAWRVSFGGTSMTIKDLAGMQILHSLLSNPRIPIRVEELAGEGRLERRYVDGEDAESWDRYVARFVAINVEIENARADSDQQEEQRLLNEQEQLAEELRGLQRECRAIPPELNRVRKRIGGAIRYAFEHLAELHPQLAQHLRESIVTPDGLTPCYSPTELERWQLV